MMIMKEPGYVYILTNPSFKEDWVKIGKSSRPVNVRSKELDNTAVPMPFEIYATLKTVKYSEVERLVHKTIDRLTDLRIRPNREFFNITPGEALNILRDISETLDDAADFANVSAPEHIELLVKEPFNLLPKIKHAGAIFLGAYSPEPLGDYFAGPNHVLPTGGTAKFYSVLNVETFLKRTSLISYTKKDLLDAAEDIIRLAETEGLNAHAEAIRKRQTGC